MFRKLVSILVITFLLTLVLMFELYIINFFLKLFKWRLNYLYYIDFLSEAIYVSVVVIFILLVSLFFRGTNMNKSKVSFTTGTTSIIFCFLFYMLFKQTSDLSPFLLLGPATFIIGFLFPMFYKIANKKPLFSNTFF